MAIGVYFALSGLTGDKYDECIRRLKKAGAAHPTGRSYHSAFGPAEKLSVFDVWSSQASFERFGRTLMPILQELGVDPGKPEIVPVYNVIKPPAAKAKPKKRAPARAAATKRGGKKR